MTEHRESLSQVVGSGAGLWVPAPNRGKDSTTGSIPSGRGSARSFGLDRSWSAFITGRSVEKHVTNVAQGLHSTAAGRRSRTIREGYSTWTSRGAGLQCHQFVSRPMQSP